MTSRAPKLLGNLLPVKQARDVIHDTLQEMPEAYSPGIQMYADCFLCNLLPCLTRQVLTDIDGNPPRRLADKEVGLGELAGAAHSLKS